MRSEASTTSVQPRPETRNKFILRVSLFKDMIRNPACYLLVLPAAIYTFLFGYMTLPYMIIAFQRFNYKSGIFNSDWVGLKNFEFFFGSSRAMEVTINTLRLNVLFIVAGVAVSVFLALLLNELRTKWFLKTAQTTMLFPHFLSWIIVSYIIYGLFASQFGFVNQVLEWLHLPTVNWYATAEPWTTILVGMRIWKDTGMQVVIYLAAIAGIDHQLYEAATIDGANRFQQMKSITIPLLMPTVFILALISIGRIFYGDFGMIYSIVKDNGMLYSTTDIIDTYVFRALRKTGDPSQAMAVGLYQAFMGFVFVYGSNWLTRRYFKDGALF
ncbi:ABC transporter permease [Paenibacillus silvisoli]|uniref:ABC transporter permease n=1 Tax=Paenibacillus silvisoli TaxID=3110539 RepID=UPI002805AA3D|nr:ABC transporter permease subunit [Paenibacillus silvisoli]